MKTLNVLLTRLALWWLTRSWRKDPEYRWGWKANIAMPFVDEYQNHLQKTKRKTVSYSDLHRIANDAAETFLRRIEQ